MTAGRSINSTSVHWGTPENYLQVVREFLGGIELDPCSNDYSIVGAKVEYKLPIDGLIETWDYKTIFVNPPYGRDKERGTSIKDWLKKCYSSYVKGSEVLALVPVATNTSHWKEYVFGKASAVCFLKDSRVKFLEDGEPTGTGAPMACSIIYYGKDVNGFVEHFSILGSVISM